MSDNRVDTTPSKAPERCGSLLPPMSTRTPSGRASVDKVFTRETEVDIPRPVPVTLNRAALTLVTGVNAGQTFALDGAEHVIGRGRDVAIWLVDDDVSRRHARLLRAGNGAWSIEDLGSTNGIFVNGARVTRSELRSGDRVHIGSNLVLRFEVIDAAEAELQQRLYESARRDPLTHLFNRAHFLERLEAEIAYARRHGTELSLLLLDLDRFKAVNDTHGHLAGDAVLRTVAQELARMVRTEDVLARYGGEEIALLTRSITKENARWLGERVRASVEALSIPLLDRTLSVTLSAGVASFSEVDPLGGAAALIGAADRRLYAAKAAGRNRIVAEG